MDLKIHPLDRLLKLEGSYGSAIPYLGYFKVNLQIPGIRGYNEDILLLVIPATVYAEKVPVMVGSTIINRAMKVIKKRNWTGPQQHGGRPTSVWSYLHHSIVLWTNRGQRSGWGGNPFHNIWPHCVQGVPPGWHQGACLHHTEDHHPSLCDHKCPLQNKHQRALYVSSCAGRAGAGSPAAHRFLPSADLSEEPECSPHHDSCKGHHWES